MPISLFNMEMNNKMNKKTTRRSRYKTPKSLRLYVPTPSSTSSDCNSYTDMNMEEYDEDQQPSTFCEDIIPRNLLESY